MPISNSVIKKQVSDLIDQTKTQDQTAAQAAFAQGIADIIEGALKSATVTVDAGILVSTTGGSGTTSGPGTGRLS